MALTSRVWAECSFPCGVRTRVGPLRDAALAAALQGPPPGPGELTLPRILSTVVDSYGVEEVADSQLVVRFEKAVRRSEEDAIAAALTAAGDLLSRNVLRSEASENVTDAMMDEIFASLPPGEEWTPLT